MILEKMYLFKMQCSFAPLKCEYLILQIIIQFENKNILLVMYCYAPGIFIQITDACHKF